MNHARGNARSLASVVEFGDMYSDLSGGYAFRSPNHGARHCRLVRWFTKAGLDPTGLAVWSGVDGSLSEHGRGSVAGMAPPT